LADGFLLEVNNFGRSALEATSLIRRVLVLLSSMMTPVMQIALLRHQCPSWRNQERKSTLQKLCSSKY